MHTGCCTQPNCHGDIKAEGISSFQSGPVKFDPKTAPTILVDQIVRRKSVPQNCRFEMRLQLRLGAERLSFSGSQMSRSWTLTKRSQVHLGVLSLLRVTSKPGANSASLLPPEHIVRLVITQVISLGRLISRDWVESPGTKSQVHCI